LLTYIDILARYRFSKDATASSWRMEETYPAWPTNERN